VNEETDGSEAIRTAVVYPFALYAGYCTLTHPLVVITKLVFGEAKCELELNLLLVASSRPELGDDNR